MAHLALGLQSVFSSRSPCYRFVERCRAHIGKQLHLAKNCQVLNLPYLFTGTQANLQQALAGKAVSLALSKDWLRDLQSMRSGNPAGLLEDAASMGLGLWGLWKQHQASKGSNEAGFSTDEADNVGLAVGEVVAITGCRSDQTRPVAVCHWG